MATAKSLKKLRSASNAFLEDGGSLLHGVDGLLRDIQQTLVELHRREEILVEREVALEAREACLDNLLKNLADNVLPATITATAESDSQLSNESPSPAAPLAPDESKVADELADIQSTVTEIVTPAEPAPTLEPTPTVVSSPVKPAITTHHSQRFSHHRKKRRR
jgi:hypothetical protein